MSADEKKPPTVRCRLCLKDVPYTNEFDRNKKIDAWSKVCLECKQAWEVGRKRQKSAKADEKLVHAWVIRDLPMDGRHGDPQAPEPVIRGTDIAAAMGATKLKGTDAGDAWKSETKGDLEIGKASDKAVAYHSGGQERVEVPKARAEAMDRIIKAVLDALARTRVDGFNEGRNLLLGLSKGQVKLESFDVQCNNARAGKQPRGRFDD